MKYCLTLLVWGMMLAGVSFSGSVFAGGPPSPPTSSPGFSFGRQRGGSKGVAALEDINVRGVKEGEQSSNLIDVIKGVTNWVLGILALIALIFALYGGFQMVTSAGDEGKYSGGWAVLKSALIGIAIIGVAWFIVSIILWLIQESANQSGGSAGTGS